jgi:hypothetical protein
MTDFYQSTINPNPPLPEPNINNRHKAPNAEPNSRNHQNSIRQPDNVIFLPEFIFIRTGEAVIHLEAALTALTTLKERKLTNQLNRTIQSLESLRDQILPNSQKTKNDE